MFTPLRTMLGEPEGRVLVASAISTLAAGTVVYMLLEGWSPLDSLYFSVVTLATVGFGDLHPTTDAAKLFTIVYIIAGLGILAAFVSELTKIRYSLRSGDRSGASATAVHEAETDAEDAVTDVEGALEGGTAERSGADEPAGGRPTTDA